MAISWDPKWALPTLLFVGGLILLSVDPSEAAGPRVLGAAMMVVVTAWMYLRLRNSEDEVVRTANVAAMATGAPIGLALAFCAIFVVRLMPPATRFVDQLAGGAAASAGFGVGVLFTCGLVVFCSLVTWVGWWVARR